MKKINKVKSRTRSIKMGVKIYVSFFSLKMKSKKGSLKKHARNVLEVKLFANLYF